MIQMDAPKKHKRFVVMRLGERWDVKPSSRQDSGLFPLFQYESGIVSCLTVWALDEAHALTKARNAIRAFQLQVEEEFLV